MRIEDGSSEQHPTPLAVNAAATRGVQRPTAVAGQQTAADQGGVLADISGTDFTGEIASAMTFGMNADSGRRQHYLAATAPLGGSAGDLLPISSPPLDPGAAPGEAEPTAAYFDPPRSY
jgi:hypothetical protein